MSIEKTIEKKKKNLLNAQCEKKMHDIIIKTTTGRTKILMWRQQINTA